MRSFFVVYGEMASAHGLGLPCTNTKYIFEYRASKCMYANLQHHTAEALSWKIMRGFIIKAIYQ